MSAVRPDLLPDVDQLARLRRVAGGEEPADLAVRSGLVLSVHTGELLRRDVLVAGPHIAAVTPPGTLAARYEIDAAGSHVVPSFVDAHFHIEYSLLTAGELARLVVPKGTTTVLADPDCIANVAGTTGMDALRRTGTPLRIFEQVTPQTPTFPELELGGAQVSEQDVWDRVAGPDAVSLGESNPFDLGRAATARFQHTLRSGRRITGHTARLGGPPLWSYLAAGVADDHNAATVAEVLERVRLGAAVTVMSGSMNDNTAIFAAPAELAGAYEMLCFCADDKHVGDLADEGHIDHNVRQAIAQGVPAEAAYTMATWNAARHYRIDHLVGSVTPTRLADLLIVDDLAAVRPRLVLVGGRVVASGGQPEFENFDQAPAWTRDTMRLGTGTHAADYRVPAAGASQWVQAMELYDGYFKRGFHCELPVEDGALAGDTERDVLQVAVIDRHHATRSLGVGFVKGFELSRGALAASTNCPSQNVVVVGTTGADMAAAVRAVQSRGGGFAVADDGEVLATLPLPGPRPPGPRHHGPALLPGDVGMSPAVTTGGRPDGPGAGRAGPERLVLRNARLVGGAAAVDVTVDQGRIASIAPAGPVSPADPLSPTGAAPTVDLGGAWLSPGWMDPHTHVFGTIGIGDPDAVGVDAGVTTLVDAGSAGPPCIEDFWALTRSTRTEVLCLSYLEARGAAQIASIPSSASDLTTLSLGQLAAGLERHPEFVKGVKFDALADLGEGWVRTALAVANMFGLPAMAHIGNFPNNRRVSVDYVRSLLRLLRPGDIVTHMYTPEPGGLFDPDGRVLDEAVQAQERGVVMDLGYAYQGFSFELAKQGLAAGFAPDTISTDLQVRTARRRVRSLASVLGRMMAAGMTLGEVTAAVTTRPRQVLGLPPLAVEVGAPADLTAFWTLDLAQELSDATGRTFHLAPTVEVVATVRAGQLVPPRPASVLEPSNLRWQVDLDGPIDPAGDPATRKVLRGLADLVDAVPPTGEMAQMALSALVDDTGADRAGALKALYLAVAGRPSGPQPGWMVADVARSHGRDALAARLRRAAGDG